MDVADFVRALRAVKLWAGDPSLEVLYRRTGVATSTLSDALNPQRRRLPSLELVRSLVLACGANAVQAAQWERAWRSARGRDSRFGAPRPVVASRSLSSARDVTPRQLPADVSGFTGRADVLVALAGIRRDAPATVITGTAGVGKTALAVHWAHQIAAHYPDGQLYLDLRGRATDPALTATEALSVLLQSLGVPGDRVPLDLHLQMGLYRSVLADRRVLVVLDNAMDAAHVRPLLPGGQGCHALVTSRDSLAGLVVRDGAARISLDILSPAESVELLSVQLGRDRVHTEQEDAEELAELCAHLPLALRITAANLAVRPALSLAGMVAELGSADLLARLQVVGDPESAVAAAFELSYRSLSPEAQRLFRFLGMMPGPEPSREAAAVLLGREMSAPVPELDELLAAHLLSEPKPGRFRSHDLLALYAKQLAGTEPEEVSGPALHRLLSWYLLTLDAANRIIRPNCWVLFPDEFPLTGSPRAFSGPHDARAWLTTEHTNLVTAIVYASEHGPAPFAWHLAHALRGNFYPHRLDGGALAASQAGLRVAEAHDHPLGRGMCHISLGFAAWDLGDLNVALEELNSAKIQFERIGYDRGLAAAWNDSAEVCARSGKIREALVHASTALTFHTDYAPSRVVHHANLAEIFRIQGDYGASQRHAEEALGLADQNGTPQTEAVAKLEAGLTQLAMGELEAAEELLSQGRAAAELVGSPNNLYDALSATAVLSIRAGRVADALNWIEPLHDLLDLGVPGFAPEDLAETAIVETYLAANRLDRALDFGTAALARRVAAGHGLTVMRLRVALGRVHAAAGDLMAARSLWEAALPHTMEESLPERTDVEGLLAMLENCA
ncbi:NB-ARC domain-containing protein [Streptomyces sp. GbtcB6]|uniref:ATP-binding protein n=1 Tax=Streptomyces sp. GbtcB6 TaxID=2824751 RepID=UPI001C2FF678|nr:tetratricopeptide repeat protein [Streptomyces sp. GbtcB6]